MGKVLALGGSLNDEDASTASLNADLYDPAANTFSFAPGANAYARLYHSNALLLPDATVWVAGGNPTRGTYEQHMEIYKPPYLFNSNGTLATRPTITSAPGSDLMGRDQFTVTTPDAANISSVVLMRPGAPTHAFDMDQRLVGMSFTNGSGTPDRDRAAQRQHRAAGILHAVSGEQQRSAVGREIYQAGHSRRRPAPTVSSISPNSGTANGGTTVTITGTGFLSGATVSLGGTAATGVTVVSSTSITATTPAHAAGAVNVVVTNTDGQSGTLNQRLYLYATIRRRR